MRLRSTTTASGQANASCTAATASLGARPPTRTPATRTPAGIAFDGVVVVVVVVVAVVVAAVVVPTVVVEDVVVTSAITAPEQAPAATSPSTKRTTACQCFTARAV